MNKFASQKQIEDYLQLFDGDIDAALKSIEEYVEIKSKKTSSPPVADKPLIVIDSLSKSYGSGKREISVLKNISLSIYEGEIVALTGPSGSGKSTLLQLMGGLDRPTLGTITVDGTNLHSMSDRLLSRFRNQTIGFVFQFFYLQPFLNLGRNIELAAMPMRTKRKERQKRTGALADATGLDERLRHFPNELSGGQIQRAAIARALFNNPKVILADEPTGNLDSKNSSAIIDLFEEIRQKYGTTIVIVTHDRSIAKRADREINLTSGSLL